jgi:tetratricopeptide (TPR) repeat protein
MLLATLLLSAALVPQSPPAEEPTPFDTPQAPTQESVTPAAPADVAPPQATPAAPPADEPPPVMEATPGPGPVAPPASTPSGSAQAHIDAGLKDFIRGRFSSARDEFQAAYELAPRSAAAAFYLGYAYYKLGEPTRRMDSNKQKAKELFAASYNLDPAFQPVWGARKSE